LIAADFDDESNGFIEVAALQQGADGLDTLVARVADLTASRDRASDACATVQRERDAAVVLLRSIRTLAGKAWQHWDADEDAKVGKILIALAGELPKYLPETDALTAFLARYEESRP